VFSEDVGDGTQGAPVITLEQLLMDYTPQGIDLLKLDCEGAEYPILLATKPETLKAIRRIVMEYHDLDARQNHRVLKAYLENAGFQVRLRGNPVHQELGYLYACQLSNLSDKL